jgi:Domain of unknown function (DUF3597)
MSIFGNIMSAIFGGAAKAQPAPAPASGKSGSVASSSTSPSTAPSAAPQSAGAGQPVDVEAVVTHLAAQKKQKLNWRTSIVDLMKVLDIDSSLKARKELAKELHYTGDMKDSAAMNIWLHKQVMVKLAQNGGKVPAELRT